MLVRNALLGTALFLGFLSGSASASQVLVTGPIGGGASLVGTLDTTIPIVPPPFPVPYELTDIARSSTGTVFGSTLTSLVSIDTVTQTASVVGAFLTTGGMTGLAFTPGDTLFGIANNLGNPSFLYNIVPATGFAIPIGSGIGGNFYAAGDLVFGPDGMFYATSTNLLGACATNCLFKINPATGVGTFIGDIGFANVFGLTYADGTLYGMTALNELLSINLATGAGTLLNPYAFPAPTFGASEAIAPTSAVPVPAALPLLASGLGLLGVANKLRRRWKTLLS